MTRLATAIISLSALQNNLAIVKQAAPYSKIMAVIKADAYGHGSVACARAMNQADAFAVARIEEAVELRENGISKAIVVLSGISTMEDLAVCHQLQLDAVIHSEETLQLVIESHHALSIWLKFDTGMHRLGLAPNNALMIKNTLFKTKHITLKGVMSHLASAEESTNNSNSLQKQQFGYLTSQFHDQEFSLSNSAGILLHNDAHFHWVRPGIMLYGSNPSPQETALSRQLQPVMTLTSSVIHIANIQAGDSVGYNGIWIANKNATIATIAIGYADGYSRHMQAGSPISINGIHFPLVGRVSMDLITVDVTNSHVKVGDIATLWGGSINVDTLAKNAGTISYELLSGLSRRVQKIYE